MGPDARRGVRDLLHRQRPRVLASPVEHEQRPEERRVATRGTAGHLRRGIRVSWGFVVRVPHTRALRVLHPTIIFFSTNTKRLPYSTQNKCHNIICPRRKTPHRQPPHPGGNPPIHHPSHPLTHTHTPTHIRTHTPQTHRPTSTADAVTHLDVLRRLEVLADPVHHRVDVARAVVVDRHARRVGVLPVGELAANKDEGNCSSRYAELEQAFRPIHSGHPRYQKQPTRANAPQNNRGDPKHPIRRHANQDHRQARTWASPR